MPRRSSPEDLIAESMRIEREAAAHRELRATGWTLTTHGGHVFMAERAGVKLPRRASPSRYGRCCGEGRSPKEQRLVPTASRPPGRL